MTDFMHRIAGGWLLAAIAAFAMTLVCVSRLAC